MMYVGIMAETFSHLFQGPLAGGEVPDDVRGYNGHTGTGDPPAQNVSPQWVDVHIERAFVA